MTGEIVNKSEFARRNGWRPSYVTQLKKEGRLVMAPDGKRVDVDASLELIRKTSSGSHAHVADRFAGQRIARAASAAAETIGAAAPEESHGRPGVKKQRELVMREMRLIELGLLKGDLVERDRVNHAWHDVGVGARANLEAMTERLAPRIAGIVSRESMAVDIALAVREEKRRIKRLLIDSLRQMRRGG